MTSVRFDCDSSLIDDNEADSAANWHLVRVGVADSDCDLLHVAEHLVRQEVPIVIAGNKSDLVETHREVRIEDVSEWVYCELPKLR